ncbi:putative centromere-associated protein E [Apostichopus japonicus]|uniref:Putative centromere-associated protein E n=1 Tax=Stichopus japonicus TaxID=307972 RepID=A0A2G8JU50_STIJA|nr:putative centromere-associated protein E [Apostichopus japonicus]
MPVAANGALYLFFTALTTYTDEICNGTIASYNNMYTVCRISVKSQTLTMEGKMDNVHVAIRVRPLIKREDDENSQIFWQADKNSICQTANKSAKPYIFDRVFAHNESTDVVYKEIAQPIVQASMNGYDGTIFAYGQTSSGKTHTMQGDANELGIIPRAVDELFDIIDKTPQREFLFRVSYMEIYNEIINDLLNEEKQQLIIRENKQRRVYVSNLHEAFVSDADEVLDLMRKGNEHRHIGQTNMNEHSSRSHTIFKVIIESRERRDDETLDLAVNCSELLVQKERMIQRHMVNASRKPGTSTAHSSVCAMSSVNSVPVRSLSFQRFKLTRILQSALWGNAKTAVVCTVTPASLDQTESTLQFASRAKTITNKPEINEILTGEAQIQRCQKEITSLKAQLEFYQQGQQVQPTAQEQERIAKLEEEKLLQQRKIQQLESMILVSKPKGQEVSISEKRKQRRLTWCPGALKRRMMNTSLTDDFLPKRNVFQRLSDGSAEEVQSLPSSSPVGLNTLNDSKEGVSFSDEAFNNVQSSPVLKRQKGVRWADHTHVATQTSNLEEIKDKEEQFQEMFTICEGLMSEKEKMEEQMKTTNVELLNLNQIISELESDKTEMSQEKENLKRVIEEAEELKLFEADEKNMWKTEEAELLARVSAMESEVASMRGEVEAAEQSKAEMEILHNMEKEKQERRVKELTSQLQLSYDEQNNQSDSALEWSENENKLKELMAETVLLREKEERTLEELSQLTNSKRELEDVIEKSKISFAELEEKFIASQTELEAVKALAEEQRMAEEKLRSSESEKVGQLETKIENLVKESDILKKALESHVEEKVKIQAEFAGERIAKEKMEQEIATSKTQIESMELNVQELQGDAETWKKALESQRTEMEEKVTELMAEIQAQKDEDRNREEEMEKLRGELAGYREEALNLKTEASDLDEARSELGRMEAELSSTRAELESLRDCKASNQEEETEVKMRELTELLEAERITVQERLEHLQSEVDRLQGLLEEMEIASTASKQSWEEIDEELKASKAQMEEQRDIYERREQDLEAQLVGMEKAVEVRQDSESGEMESHKLLEEVEKYKEEIDRLQGQITLLEADSARTLESSSRCEQLELELRNVREELVRGKQDEDVTAEVSKNEDAERLRGETERYQAELEQLREEIVTLRKTDDNLAEAKSKLARAEEELEDAKMKEEESRCELEVLQEEVALFKDLNNDLTDAEAKLTIKEQELESARSEIDQYLVR